VIAEVVRVDARARRVYTADGRTFEFDACIVATGGIDATFGVPGADRHAMSFKSVEHCAAIGRRLSELARSSGRKSVVIVGGGLEGVEALGEILRRYRDRGSIEVAVVEAGPRLLNGSPHSLDARIRRHCEGLPVRVLTGTRVDSVTRRRVELAGGGSLRSDLTIWSAGLAPSPLLHASRLADRPGQWARVRPSLQSRRYARVFVIGDAAELVRPLAKQAFFAIQMGECAASNAKRLLAGRATRAFRPAPKPMLVAFGDLDTFMVAGGRAVASPSLAAAKEGVFQLTMAQLDPPLGATPLREFRRRLAAGAGKIAWPAIAMRDRVRAVPRSSVGRRRS
jgi:NADH dehydrogenase